MTEVPVTAGVNQYWFSKDGNYSGSPDNTWLIDPNNPYKVRLPTDGWGLGDATKRAIYNPIYVPYDAETMGDFAPMAARAIEVPREGIAHGTWGYVNLPADINEGTEVPSPRQVGVYLPPNYNPTRAEGYKTIYMQHGGTQDASDWMNIGSVPHVMDNLIADGLTEPAIVITTTATMGNAALGYLGEGYSNVPKIVDFIDATYNTAVGAENRSFAGLSSGSRITAGIIASEYYTLFNYYGVWSGGMQELIGEVVGGREPEVIVPVEHLQNIYILAAQGSRDTARSNVSDEALATFYSKAPGGAYLKVSGIHDFNTWVQQFSAYAKDFLWKPEAFRSTR
jgi:enterochelin esterase-like enzyme